MSIVIDTWPDGEFCWTTREELSDDLVVMINISEQSLPQWIEQGCDKIIGMIRPNELYVFVKMKTTADAMMAILTSAAVDKDIFFRDLK